MLSIDDMFLVFIFSGSPVKSKFFQQNLFFVDYFDNNI